MDEVTVSGHSDDIIHVEGAVGDEMYLDADVAYIGLSCNVLVSVRYDGEWHVQIERPYPDDVDAWHYLVGEHDSEYIPDYSEVVTVEAPSIDWAVSTTGRVVQ